MLFVAVVKKEVVVLRPCVLSVRSCVKSTQYESNLALNWNRHDRLMMERVFFFCCFLVCGAPLMETPKVCVLFSTMDLFSVSGVWFLEFCFPSTTEFATSICLYVQYGCKAHSSLIIDLSYYLECCPFVCGYITKSDVVIIKAVVKMSRCGSKSSETARVSLSDGPRFEVRRPASHCQTARFSLSDGPLLTVRRPAFECQTAGVRSACSGGLRCSKRKK